MRRLGLTLGTLALLAAPLLLAACGGEGEGTPTPVPAELREKLQRMVLQADDLPTGVVRAEELFVTNEETAAASEDREERLALLNQWGRILGYEVTYQASPSVMEETGLILVNSAASLYSSDAGASASFADAVQEAHTTDWAARFGVESVQVEEVASPPLTQEMLWLRITAKAALGEAAEEETFASDVVLFRQGSGRGSLMAGWVMGKADGDVIKQLAERQAQRLKDALP